MTNGAAPVLTVIAGPNGAGKSTYTLSMRLHGKVPVLDPDAVARHLRPDAPELAAAQAGREILQRQQEHVNRGTSFAIETTLAGSGVLRLMKQARGRGFRVQLRYIGVDNVRASIDRIIERFARGGHSVPEGDVRRSYERSMRNLKQAIERADRAAIYDNSTDEGPRQVLAFENGRLTMQVDNLLAWVVTSLGPLTR